MHAKLNLREDELGDYRQSPLFTASTGWVAFMQIFRVIVKYHLF